jgi:hypothetical protein
MIVALFFLGMTFCFASIFAATAGVLPVTIAFSASALFCVLAIIADAVGELRDSHRASETDGNKEQEDEVGKNNLSR